MAASVAVFGHARSDDPQHRPGPRHSEENARLAVDNERNRFARDLHDILGHSLTVITVKAELAQRLLDVDPARAKAEVADLERLSRDALSDVRRAVEGYRELTLPGELARARTALAAAEIDADLPNSTEEVPSDRRELFAWTVREGVTNVIRHSGAQRCTVRLTHDAAEVLDDGRGPTEDPAGGSGLLGLRERAAARRGHRRHAGRRAVGFYALRGPVVPRSGCCSPTTRPWCAARSSALLDLEPDLEVVAEVGTRRRRAWPPSSSTGPTSRCSTWRCPASTGSPRRRRCAPQLPETKVLIVTTFGRPGYLRRALQAGASGFVVKDTPAASSPTPYAGCSRACASSTRRWPPTACSPASRR